MRKIPLYFYLLLLLSAFGCGEENLPTNCIDPDKIRSGVCNFAYIPVCGCDGKTYSNACVADLAGLKSWSSGECK